MSGIDALVEEFRRAYVSGEHPDAGDYLLRVPQDDRDELGRQIRLVLADEPPPATRYVYLNARESRESEGRRRFTLAHEIGHWVCQCDEGRSAAPEPILCRASDMSGTGSALEREANNFAASAPASATLSPNALAMTRLPTDAVTPPTSKAVCPAAAVYASPRSASKGTPPSSALRA